MPLNTTRECIPSMGWGHTAGRRLPTMLGDFEEWQVGPSLLLPLLTCETDTKQRQKAAARCCPPPHGTHLGCCPIAGAGGVLAA